MTTTTKTTVLGEFGMPNNVVYVVKTVPGKVAEVKRLWTRLDSADGMEQAEIIAKLVEMGAASRE